MSSFQSTGKAPRKTPCHLVGTGAIRGSAAKRVETLLVELKAGRGGGAAAKFIDASDIFSQEHGSGLESVVLTVGQDRRVSFRALSSFIGPMPRDEFIGAQAMATRYTRT